MHMQLFDANHNSHLPLPMLVTPYVVQRFIVNIPVVTSLSTNTYVVVCANGVASAANLSSANITPVVALTGVGATTLSGMTQVISADLSNLSGVGAELAFSAISASIVCSSSNNTSSGNVWMARSNAPIENWGGGSATMDTVFGSFNIRQDVKPMSYMSLYAPHKVLGIPMDFVAYETFQAVYPSPGTSVLNTSVNAITPIIFMFGPGVAVYNIRAAFEARVRYPLSDARYTLHQRHTPTPQGVFNGLVSSAEDVIGGVIEEATGAMVGRAVRATRGVLGVAR